MAETEVYAGEEAEMIEYKAFTARAVVLALFFGLLWIFAQIIMGVAAGYMWTGEGAAAMMIISYALFAALRQKNVRLEEYGVIFGITEVICCASLGWAQYAFPSTVLALASPRYKAYGEYLPSFLAPAAEDQLRAAMYGGAIRWGEWITPIIFYIAFGLVMFLFSMFVVMPVRKQVIEIERLPFPVATVSATVVRMTAGREHPERLRWLWLGLLIGFLVGILQEGFMLTKMFPGFGGIPISHDFTPNLQDLFPGSALMIAGLTPDLIAWAYIIPLETQLTMVLFGILFYVVIATIQVRLGWVTYEPGGGWYDYSYVVWLKGISTIHLTEGTYFAAAIVPVLISTAYLKRMFRSLISGPTDEEKEEEPLTYRTMWAIIVVLFVAAVGLLMMLRMPAIMAVVMMIIQGITFHMYMRSIGAANWSIPIPTGIQRLMNMIFFQPWPGMEKGFFEPMSQAGFSTGLSDILTLEAGSGGGVSSMETFRFAFLTRMKPKDMLKAQLIGAFMSLTIGILLVLFLLGKFGGLSEQMKFMYGYVVTRAANQMRVNLGGFSFKIFVAGFILGAAIILARIRFPWLPIDAYGIVLAGLLNEYILLYMITLILKYFTLKIGGTRGYEGVAIPFVAGLATGGILVGIYTGILSLLDALGVQPIAGVSTILILGVIFILITVIPTVIAIVRAFTRA